MLEMDLSSRKVSSLRFLASCSLLSFCDDAEDYTQDLNQVHILRISLVRERL